MAEKSSKNGQKRTQLRSSAIFRRFLPPFRPGVSLKHMTGGSDVPVLGLVLVGEPGAASLAHNRREKTGRRWGGSDGEEDGVDGYEKSSAWCGDGLDDGRGCEIGAEAT